MLVLSRRAEEEIVIDGRIRIKVLTNSRGKVRLGISAPADVRIERSELVDRQAVESLAAPHCEPHCDGVRFDTELLTT